MNVNVLIYEATMDWQENEGTLSTDMYIRLQNAGIDPDSLDFENPSSMQDV